jgi:hypothetical protein
MRSKVRVTLFHRKSVKELPKCRSPFQHIVRKQRQWKTAKLQPQRVRVTLLGNLERIGCRFGSLGLNLACKGLLLRMPAKGPLRFPWWSLTLVHIASLLHPNQCTSRVCFYGMSKPHLEVKVVPNPSHQRRFYWTVIAKNLIATESFIGGCTTPKALRRR